MKAKELQNRVDGLRKEITRAASCGTSALNTHIILQSQAEIAILVGQLAEISTRRLIRVTWVIAILTFSLLLFTVALYKEAHDQIQREKLQQYHNPKNP